MHHMLGNMEIVVSFISIWTLRALPVNGFNHKLLMAVVGNYMHKPPQYEKV